jgi:hypothetical protein
MNQRDERSAARAIHITIVAYFSKAGLAVALLAVGAVTALTASRDAAGTPLRYRGGVRHSPEPRYQLKAKQIELALRSLREKSGFPDMHFDEDGFLNLGDRTRIAGGSAAARALLIAAVEGPRAFELESHHHSDAVAFARLGSSVLYHSQLTQARIDVFPLKVDFYDFSQLRGDREVIAAFDVGFAILHELAHGALRLRDAQEGGDELGACEQYINRIRRELGLPERQQYYAQLRSRTFAIAGRLIKQAELPFARLTNKKGQTKTEQFYLSWEAQTVGLIADQPRPKEITKDRAAWLP